MHQSIIWHLSCNFLHLGGLEATWNCFNNNNISFHLPPTSSHHHPLQVENCDSNSRHVVDVPLLYCRLCIDMYLYCRWRIAIPRRGVLVVEIKWVPRMGHSLRLASVWQDAGDLRLQQVWQPVGECTHPTPSGAPILLKAHTQAKIIKKSVILFWFLNMIIILWCKHVHKLELQINFCAAHSPVWLNIETKLPYFLFLT